MKVTGLAHVFNPTETKKNGPARMPATPAPRSGFAFTAALVVLPDTSQSYGDALRTAHWTQRGLLWGQQSSASPTARSSSVGARTVT